MKETEIVKAIRCNYNLQLIEVEDCKRCEVYHGEEENYVKCGFNGTVNDENL